MSAAMAGKVGLVIGGASGIGRGVAERFAAEGARVVIADKNEELAREVAAGIGDAAVVSVVHIGEEEQVARMVAEAVAAFGRIDAMLNSAFQSVIVDWFGELVSAAVGPDMTGDEIIDAYRMPEIFGFPTELWREEVKRGLVDQFVCMKHVSRQMALQGDGGSIIPITSITADQVTWGSSAYVAAKAGLHMLIRCAALELGQHRIKVNGISPGLTDTPMTDWITHGRPEILDPFLRVSPLVDYGRPSDMAAAAVWLATDESRWVTGTVLTIDGGSVLYEAPRLGAPRDVVGPSL